MGKQELIEAAMNVCDMIEDMDLKNEKQEAVVAVIAARLLTEGNRELLLGLSKESVGIIDDAGIKKLVSECGRDTRWRRTPAEVLVLDLELDDEDDEDED